MASSSDKNIGYSFGARFDTYKGSSTIASASAEWLQNNISSVMPDVLSNENMENFAILGVGSFDGEKDIIIMDHVKKTLKQEIPFLYSAVEPCATALDEFEKVAVKLFNKENRSFTFNKMAIPFSSFMEKKHQPNSYDFIHFIHCVNYIDIEKALIHCFNKELKDSGKIMVIVTGKDSIKKFSDQFRNKKVPCSFTPYTYNTPDEIEKIAKDQGWEYEVKLPYVSEIDVTECLTGSDAGDNLSEFLIKGEFRQHATPELREEIKESLLKLSTEVDGKRIMYQTNVSVVITKH